MLEPDHQDIIHDAMRPYNSAINIRRNDRIRECPIGKSKHIKIDNWQLKIN